MPIVGGLDIHRKQLTFDYLDTETEEVKRGQIAPADRAHLRRVRISPLGAARRATPKPPRAWRVVPRLAGLAELGFWTIHGYPASIGGQVQASESSFALTIVGLFIAGPWLTTAAARVMARWTRRLGTQDAKDLTRWGSAAEANVLTDQVSVSNQAAHVVSPRTKKGAAGPGPAAPVAPLTAQLNGIPGVQGVLVVRADPGLTIPGTFHDLGVSPLGTISAVPAGVVSCAQLAVVPALGRCPAGATAAAFPADGLPGHGAVGARPP